MSYKKIPCIKCGGEAVYDKICGDNGSSYNGVLWRLECSKCEYAPGDWIRSSYFAVGEWESANKVTELSNEVTE